MKAREQKHLLYIADLRAVASRAVESSLTPFKDANAVTSPKALPIADVPSVSHDVRDAASQASGNFNAELEQELKKSQVRIMRCSSCFRSA